MKSSGGLKDVAISVLILIVQYAVVCYVAFFLLRTDQIQLRHPWAEQTSLRDHIFCATMSSSSTFGIEIQFQHSVASLPVRAFVEHSIHTHCKALFRPRKCDAWLNQLYFPFSDLCSYFNILSVEHKHILQIFLRNFVRCDGRLAVFSQHGLR